jgi:hypothetical protein
MLGGSDMHLTYHFKTRSVTLGGSEINGRGLLIVCCPGDERNTPGGVKVKTRIK